VSSDPGAFNEYTNSIIKLKNGYITKIEDDKIEHYDSSVKNLVQCNIVKMYNHTYEISKENYSSFMEKEIYEQPKCIDNCLLGRIDGYNVKLGGFEDRRYIFNRARRITLLGCGSSWHAGLLGKYFIEEISGLPVNVEYASEFRYRNPVIENGDIVIGISQSGETADTIAAMEMAKKKGAIVVGICNTEGSSISEISECGIYTRCGVEVGVASTKTFTNQCLCLLILSLWIEQTTRYSDLRKRNKIVDGLRELPILCAETLKCNKKIQRISKTYASAKNCLFLGRRYNYPVALEGALKLKEISYIHAEGYPAAEMKHGPIALIDENMPVVILANDSEQYLKIMNNKSEVETRGAKVLIVNNQINDKEVSSNDINVPRCEDILAPFVSIIPLQFLAMYTAMQLGRNVDRPRNLAKSVTVE
jgi:glucosamine--fructose-6-phosphate aminotransferase (isomerizing)